MDRETDRQTDRQAYWVVHESLDAADESEVELAVSHVCVHTLEEGQHNLQTILVDEPQHKTAQKQQNIVNYELW